MMETTLADKRRRIQLTESECAALLTASSEAAYGMTAGFAEGQKMRTDLDTARYKVQRAWAKMVMGV